MYGSTEPPVRQEDVAAVYAAHDRGQHRVDENAEGGAGGWEEDSERDQGRRCARLLTQEKRVQGRGEVFANVSAGADTKANTSGAAAHLRLVIFVSLRTAASAVAPSAPISLPPRLRARDRVGNGERE